MDGYELRLECEVPGRAVLKTQLDTHVWGAGAGDLSRERRPGGAGSFCLFRKM